MALTSQARNDIFNVLIETVRLKLNSYRPETGHMPFHHRLLGKDRYSMFSFIQSINTTFGMSIWEQVSVILATAAGNDAVRQFRLLGEINEDAQMVINNILYELRKGEACVDKVDEIKRIGKAIKKGKANEDPDSVVDLFVKIKDEENYFDITSVKPNMKEFAALKLKLLRWTALRLSQKRNARVFTRLGVPYNPYYPEPYERWTLRGLYDLNKGEILVGEDFWNFVASDNVYDDLLDIFDKAGKALRNEIDEKFKEFRS